MDYVSMNATLGAGVVFLLSFTVTYWATPLLIRKLLSAGITGKDINKRGSPEIAEMGGLSILLGFVAGMLLSVGLYTFFGFDMNLTKILIGLITVMGMAFIGIFDDLFDMRQDIKALLPIFAAIPLMAIRAGSTVMVLPLVGPVDFGLLYVLVLVPLGVTVASNLTNMLAGFNGLESGMGAIMTGAIAIIAFTYVGVYQGSLEALIIASAACGGFVAFTIFNWFPARVFPGDVGTLIIGGSVVSAVIIGNMEAAGAMLVLPHVVDFFIKAKNGFPSKGWWGKNRRGKLYPPEKPVGLAQYIMGAFNGIHEKTLVIVLLVAEAILGLVAIGVFRAY